VTAKRFAVIIGADGPALRYAPADARAIADVLSHQQVGTFGPADVTTFIGPAADAEAIKQTLWSIVREAGEADVLLIYFAGQILSGEADARLVTRESDAGLRMSFLRGEILGAFRGTALLILDCSSPSDSPGSDFDLISGAHRGESQFCTVMACASGGAAREDDALGHGVLTHHVLQALRGEATDDRGRVTFQAMTNYVLEQQLDPRPGVVMKARGGTTPLTVPGRAADVRIVPLEGPLDRHAPALTALIDGLARVAGAAGPGVSKVDRLRLATGSESVALLEYRGGSSHRGDFYQVLSTARFDLGDVRHLLGSRPDLHFPTHPLWFGHVTRSPGKALFCMPIGRPDGKTLLLAFVDPAEELIAIGEPLAKIIETVWHTDVPASPQEAEIHVLTALRQTFGRLPTTLYERCLSLYREVLESFVIVFQPVIKINPDWHKVSVHSYEALARRSAADNRAPMAMLKVAPAWGDRFLVERDRVIVRKALTSYARAHAAGPWAEDFPKPVSVNVAVRSLLSDAYIAGVRDAIDAAGLDAANVTLEISEQDPIEERSGERWPGEPHAYFHQRLVDLARDVGVSFAVDDFGVGYATVSRMAELPLTQIKVDRAMLHHPQAAAELDLVMRVARDPVEQGTAHIGRVVIVEGVDDESPLTLKEIYDQKIRHVQGYIARTPVGPQLSALADEVRQDIAARVRGDEQPSGLTIRDSPPGEQSLRRGA
jgi:EAL domain-containing protein (putative c-di-GMP-specific phosphodiesterase class I)